MSKKNIFIGLVISGILLYYFRQKTTNTYEYFKGGETLKHHNGLNFSGSESCISCHEDIYNQHLKTAHYLTSTIPSRNTVRGIKEARSNSYKVGDNHTYFVKEKSNHFFQILVNDSTNKTISEDKIDLVIGSGVKGQSFFSWEKNKLFQIQTSYFVPAKQWVNSPGYENKTLPKERQISLSCLECHATFAKKINETSEKELLKSSFILGVDCERCHGPAAKHVEYQNNFPNDTLGKFIVKQNKLTRQQKMDMCALCHSGSKSKIPKKEFHFVLGDTLSNYLVNDFRSYYKSKFKAKLDVHGNQVELLESSECFKKSTAMDCNTCHSPHTNERGNLENFNNICLNCHKNSKKMNCGLLMDRIKQSNKNCIDCHMPLFESNLIKIQKSDSLIKVKVRSHSIKIYEDSENHLTEYIRKL